MDKPPSADQVGIASVRDIEYVAHCFTPAKFQSAFNTVLNRAIKMGNGSHSKFYDFTYTMESILYVAKYGSKSSYRMEMLEYDFWKRRWMIGYGGLYHYLVNEWLTSQLTYQFLYDMMANTIPFTIKEIVTATKEISLSKPLHLRNTNFLLKYIEDKKNRAVIQVSKMQKAVTTTTNETVVLDKRGSWKDDLASQRFLDD